MKGSTLIETLIYITLFSILMMGIFSSISMIIHLQEKHTSISATSTTLLLKNYYE